MKRLPLLFCISLLLLSLLGLYSCGTTQKATQGGPSKPGDTEEGAKRLTKEEQELQRLLDEHRSSLAGNKQAEQLEIPKAFAKEDTSDSNSLDQNPYQGYRVQLVSTRDAKKADKISNEFQEWVKSMVPEYPAQSYVLFKQPYYKVHVGDFQNRTRAIRFTRIIKEKYPGAWIVPNRINPANVAADSVSFSRGKKDSLPSE